MTTKLYWQVRAVSGVGRELMTDGLRSPSFEFAPFLTLARPPECVIWPVCVSMFATAVCLRRASLRVVFRQLPEGSVYPLPVASQRLEMVRNYFDRCNDRESVQLI